MTTAEQFKAAAPARRRRLLHAAINSNGRLWVTSVRQDEARYHEGRTIRSTYPVSVMVVLMQKIK
jgi:hypothetical protein